MAEAAVFEPIPVPYTINDCMNVVREYQQSYPVMTVPMANALGLEVYKASGWPPESMSGQLLKVSENGGSSGYAIYVNGDHPVERRRFTIAHEIAHFILHRELINEGIEENGLYQSRLSRRRSAWQAASRLTIS